MAFISCSPTKNVASPSTNRKLVNERESKGYVRREPDLNNRRAKLIVPTELGRNTVSLALEVITNLEQQFQEVLRVQWYDVLRSAITEL